ncbi:hypothetical protein CHARACLAT_018289 [Characodon lateralis]|uniref:Uncharacterized protein n=1 Tax=Characodon lateralis TaxID=208331 RepID=A0ABU7DK57_9TELE|nr:hypothetical protein [Characodon lateralis]
MPLPGGLPPLPNLPNLNLPLPDLSAVSLAGTSSLPSAAGTTVPSLAPLPPLSLPGLGQFPPLLSNPPLLSQTVAPFVPASGTTASVTVTAAPAAGLAIVAAEADSTKATESPAPTDTTLTPSTL